MFILTKSYGDCWRVSVPEFYSVNLHAHFAKNSVWKGYDKVDSIEGVKCLGYEFSNITEATNAISIAVETIGPS